MGAAAPTSWPAAREKTWLDGGSGDDDITGGPGFDWVMGDAGADQLRLRDGEADHGVCGDDADVAIGDLADSLLGRESVDLPAVAVPSVLAPIASAPAPPAPDTTGLKGPRTIVRGQLATFRFGSTQTGGSFKCKIDKGALKPCKSPFKVRTGNLDAGKKHTLSVVAINSAIALDPTPATLKFSVEEKPKPRKRG